MILKASSNYFTLEIVTACISIVDSWGDDVDTDASCVGMLAIFPSVFIFWYIRVGFLMIKDQSKLRKN